MHGPPILIHCDMGTPFNAEEVKSLMITSYGIDLAFGVFRSGLKDKEK